MLSVLMPAVVVIESAFTVLLIRTKGQSQEASPVQINRLQDRLFVMESGGPVRELSTLVRNPRSNAELCTTRY